MEMIVDEWIGIMRNPSMTVYPSPSANLSINKIGEHIHFNCECDFNDCLGKRINMMGQKWGQFVGDVKFELVKRGIVSWKNASPITHAEVYITLLEKHPHLTRFARDWPVAMGARRVLNAKISNSKAKQDRAEEDKAEEEDRAKELSSTLRTDLRDKILPRLRSAVVQEWRRCTSITQYAAVIQEEDADYIARVGRTVETVENTNPEISYPREH